MKYLSIKLMRDLKRNWTQFFSVFLMAFLCIVVFMGMQGSWGGLDKSLDNFIDKNNLADGWIVATEINEEKISKMKKLSGIEEVSYKYRVEVTNNRKPNKSTLSLDSYTMENISGFSLYEGKMLENENQILLSKEYAIENNYKIGDKLFVDSPSGNESEFVICGLIQSSEKIYYTGMQEFIAPNYKDYGYGIVSNKAIKGIDSTINLHKIIEFTGKNKDYRKNFEDIFGSSFISYFSRETLNDIATPIERVGQIRNLSYLFSFLFILLAILAMYTTIRRLIENQVKEIAVLKAMGFSNVKIGIHYASFGLIVGTMGAVTGALVAPAISWFILSTQKSMFSIPKWYISYDYNSVLVIILVIVVNTMAAFFASQEARTSLPSEFLSGVKSSKVHHILLEKIYIWNKISFGNRWALRDISVNRIRFVMGVIGVAGGMMLLIAGIGMPESINKLVDKAYSEDFTYDRRVYTTNYIDNKIDTQLAQKVDILSARFEPDDGYNRFLMIISNGNFVNMKTIDGENIDSKGVYVTQGFANRASIKKGMNITVRPGLDTKEYTFEVAGIIISETNQGVYITQELWEKSKGIFLPKTMLIDRQTDPYQILNGAAVTKIISIEEQRTNALEFVQSLYSIFLMIIAFAILLIVVILYNLGSLNFVERMRDFATLRVLGFSKNKLRNITMYENLLTTIIGWLIGIPLGYIFLDQYVRTFSTIHLEYTSYVSWNNILLSSIIVWICSLSTTFFVSHRIGKIDMVSALKSVE